MKDKLNNSSKQKTIIIIFKGEQKRWQSYQKIQEKYSIMLRA